MEEKPKILVVDDMDANRSMLRTFLTPLGYTIAEAADGAEALTVFNRERPDLLILDLNMPNMDGFEVCKRLKSDPETKVVPIIVITGLADDKNHLKALENGADDFLAKPFNIHFLKARLKSLLELKRLHDQNLEYQDSLKQSNISLMQRVISTQDITIIALAKLAEFRDPETGEHLERMREFAGIVALELSKHPEYESYITDQYIENIYKSMPLHDIGKVGIPDNILLKPGKLTDEEFEIMKRHSTIGGDAISAAIKPIGSGESFLDMGRVIAYHHHEKWNGRGYPKGLSGEDIPLSARIASLADVYDALTTKRVYKPAFEHEKAKSIIVEESGQSFDPTIVDAFLNKEKEFIEIKEKFKDREEDSS
jgi:putative two-component system response regulator